jgi:CRP-like cAMP-binding protein
MLSRVLSSGGVPTSRRQPQQPTEVIMSDTGLLSKFSFFSEVPPKTLDAIAAICRVLNFPHQSVVFQSGEPADTLYRLIEGEVELSLQVHDKTLKADVQHEEAVRTQMVDHIREIVVDTVRHGQVFGWTALVGTGRRAVTARCATSTRVWALAATELQGMLTHDAVLGHLVFKRLAEIISRRLNARTDRLLEAWVETFGSSKIIPFSRRDL